MTSGARLRSLPMGERYVDDVADTVLPGRYMRSPSTRPLSEVGALRADCPCPYCRRPLWVGLVRKDGERSRIAYETGRRMPEGQPVVMEGPFPAGLTVAKCEACRQGFTFTDETLGSVQEAAMSDDAFNPAFPQTAASWFTSRSDDREPVPSGLTKREWLAGLALQGLLASESSGLVPYLAPERACEHAVRYADMLLAELAKEETA